MSNVKYAIIHGQLQINRKEINGFQKGDAIWGEDATPKIAFAYDNLEDARNQFDSFRCTYHNQGISGLCVNEYALIECRIEEHGVYFHKDGYKLANEELNDGGDIIVGERFVLNGDYRTVDDINMAIRNQEHIDWDWFSGFGKYDWENWVEWRDGKTIILEEYKMI